MVTLRRFLSTRKNTNAKWCKCSTFCGKWCSKNYFVPRQEEKFISRIPNKYDPPCPADKLPDGEKWLVTEFELLVMKGVRDGGNQELDT